MGKVDGVGEGTLIRHSDVSHPLFPGVENLDLRAGEADPSGFWWAKSIRVTLENIAIFRVSGFPSREGFGPLYRKSPWRPGV